MELQAIRYAAMVSTMTFAQAVETHSTYLTDIGKTIIDAQSAILKFLDWDEPRENEFAQDTRIILVSGEFSKEITTSVLWLNQRELDIRCIRLRPYRVDAGRTFLDIQQVIPLPEAAEYQIQVRKKASEERQSQESGADWTRYDLNIRGQLHPRQYKRGLFLQIVTALVRHGISFTDIMKIIPERKFLSVPGRYSSEQFKVAASEITKSNGSAYALDRYFTGEGELLYDENRTYALSNQWSKKRLPWLDELIAKYPDAGISYSRSKDELG